MSTTVQNDVLIKTLLKHLKNKQKVSVNLTFRGDSLIIQSSNEFLLDTVIKVESNDEDCSYSISINNCLLLFGIDNDIVELIKYDKYVVIKKGFLSIPFETVYDERISLSYGDSSSSCLIDANVIKDISYIFKSLSSVSKILDRGEPDVTINNGIAYCMYQDTISMSTIPLSFPNVCIPYNTFNNLVKIVDNGKINISDYSSKKVLLLNTSNNNLISLSYKKIVLDSINALRNILDSLKDLGDFNIKYIKTLELLYKCYPRESITLNFYDNKSVGLVLNNNDGYSITSKTDESNNIIKSIIINTAQLDSILKLFKSDTTLNICIGDDIICMKSITKRTLVLSGMTF